MKDFIKGKFFTALTVVITVILAGVAIFTAIRLYQLRQEPVSPASPESEPSAWDCRSYVFSVSSVGVVSVANNSNQSEASQQAQVYINNQIVTTLDVPSLPSGQSATLGTVNVPQGETFSWRVVGTKDCQNSGTSTSSPISCKQLQFSLAKTTPTPTVTGIVTPTVTISPSPTLPPGVTSTPSPTPTDRPIGGNTPTPTTPPDVTSSPSPTPTTQQIAQTSPTSGGMTLPDAGISAPTIFGLSLGLLLIMAALLLAF